MCYNSKKYIREETLMQNNKVTELSVSTEVLEKMAELAANEVSGVAGLAKRALDIKGAVKTKNAFKGVKVECINGAIDITVYICVDPEANVRTVAEAVQQSVKDKIQAMTATAVTRVNVVIADVDLKEKAEAADEEEI